MPFVQDFLTSSRLSLRLMRLFAGLFAYGVAIAFILRAGLGASPWDVLAQGVGNAIGFSFGTVTVAVSVVVLLFWVPLRQRPGWGTLANALLVGVFADLGLAFLPASTALAPTALVWATVLAQCVFLAVGLVLLSFASALYIGAGLGPGPRDGLMTGIVGRTGWPVWLVRSAIEVLVTGLGWLLGGTVGIGTAAFACGIGPLIQLALRVLQVDLAKPKILSEGLGRSEGPAEGEDVRVREQVTDAAGQ